MHTGTMYVFLSDYRKPMYGTYFMKWYETSSSLCIQIHYFSKAGFESINPNMRILAYKHNKYPHCFKVSRLRNSLSSSKNTKGKHKKLNSKRVSKNGEV
jgi:hypothetical protein